MWLNEFNYSEIIKSIFFLQCTILKTLAFSMKKNAAGMIDRLQNHYQLLETFQIFISIPCSLVQKRKAFKNYKCDSQFYVQYYLG